MTSRQPSGALEKSQFGNALAPSAEKAHEGGAIRLTGRIGSDSIRR
jgi:hypothetical protein